MAQLPLQDPLDALYPDICLCCKRSKSQGSFFAIVRIRGKWEFGSWDGTMESFRFATEQGCRRCGFVYDAVKAHGHDLPAFNWRRVTVRNALKLEDAMRAEIRIALPGWIPRSIVYLQIANSRGFPVQSSNFPWNFGAELVHDQDPTSAAALEPAELWLGECTSTHEHCDSKSTASLPRKVLELSKTSITLREDVEPQHQRYACLSHCWGPQGPSLRLTKETSADLRRGIPIENLPKTFSEAALVCLRLKIPYLWIDALCIFQDDLGDWENTAGLMAGIYEHAYLTIAAACAKDSSDGLRPLEGGRYQAKLIPSTGMYVRESYEEFSEGDLYPGRFPLLERAWVFQERRLSPRILYFSVYRLVWECRTIRHVEGESQAQSRDLWRGSTNANVGSRAYDDSVVSWREDVQVYSRLRLTYDSDKLPAIAALASKMSLIRKHDTYLCGLWKSSLLHDLRWYADGRSPRCNSGAPTWSWASISGPISFDRRAMDWTNLKLLDVEYNPVGPIYIGRSTRSRITISSNAIKLKRGPRINLDLDDQDDLHVRCFVMKDYKFSNDSSQNSLDEVLIMLLFGTCPSDDGGVYCGMVLQKLHDGTDFERVGWMRLRRRPINLRDLGPDHIHPLDALVARSPTKIVTIV